LLLLLTTIGLFATPAAADPPAGDAGGPRRVEAVVRTAGDAYVIQVRFRAIACFDRATNREMNLGLGRSFALQALARRLSDNQKVELVVSGARTTDSELDGKTASLTVRVPRSGVKVVETREASGGATPGEVDGEDVHRATADASAGSRKGQYESMIAQLGQLLRKEWKGVRAAAAPDAPPAERTEAFRRKLATSFDQLAGEIRADLELTTLGSDLDPDSKSEKDQLLARLKGERERLLRELKPR
jgi:hypothetical protein